MHNHKASKKNVRLALVGVGGIGQQWVDALGATPGVDLVAVVDVNRAAAQKVAATFSHCVAYSDWREIMRDPAIDAVIAATPTRGLRRFRTCALGKKTCSL